MRRLLLLSALLTAILIPEEGDAGSCTTQTVGASLIKHQVHCDLVKGLNGDDIAFLSENLGKPYRISANEVSEEAIDSAFYLAIALIEGQGIEKDIPKGAEILAQIASQRDSFDAHDRDGKAFFTDLGLELNVRIDVLRAVLVGVAAMFR